MPRGKAKRGRIEDLSADHFTFRKTTYHGFPHGPTALAFDQENQLLVIGTKYGELRVYGRPGVEFKASLDSGAAITALFMISGVHQIISVAADNSITTWELSTDGQPMLSPVKQFKMDPEGGKTITKCCLSQHSGHFYIGTEGANLYTLDVKLFELDPEIVYWNNATTLIQSSSKAHPGKIVSLELCPINHNLILIGYEKGIIVLWDFDSGLPTKNFPASIQDCQQPLESVSWQNEGCKFVTSHSNSALYYWCLTSSSPHEGPTLHYGSSNCASVTKVRWLNTDSNPLIIFAGGLPLDQADDHNTVTVIQGADHVALDFTSPVVDFVGVADSRSQKGSVLFVLCEQEITAFDLEAPKCPQIRKPYLFCLHASPVTCVRLYENCSSQIFDHLHEVTVTSPPSHEHVSMKEWPALGGCVRAADPQTFDVLVTGHENGCVKFWDVTTGAMRLIYELKTANLFMGQESQAALMEDFSDFKWPPYHKVSSYDPFEDDPRLAIKCLEFCPYSRTLSVGGNAGQVITFSLNPSPAETSLKVETAKIFMGEVVRTRRAALGSVQPLECKSDLIQLPAGFQANFCLQCLPPTAITSIAFRPSWGVVAAGSSKGFVVANFLVKQVVLVHPTVRSDGVGSRSITRIHSFRRSLRESFRQRRSSVAVAGTQDRRKIAESLNLEAATDLAHKNSKQSRRARASSEPTSPVAGAGAGNDQPVSPEVAGIVSHLCFTDTHVAGGGTSPAIFASTMGSSVIRYTLTLPDPRERLSQINKALIAGKDYSLVHAAPIVSLFILDHDGVPIPGPYEVEYHTVAAPNARSPHFAVICTSEQIKVVSLPAMKQKRKEKLMDHIQEKIHKAWVVRVKVPAAPVGAARDWNPALVVLTTAGSFLAFSLPDLRLCFQETNLVSASDQKALQSLTVSVYGEVLYLRSFSELQRCLLCSYGFSYHSSMLPSLFAFEGSTNPVQLPKKSSLRRRQVVQVEVTSEVPSRDRRSETPSPENIANGISGSDDSDEKPAAAVAEVKQPSVEREKVVAVDLTDIGPSVRQRSPPHDEVPPVVMSPRTRSDSSSSSSSSGSSDSSDNEGIGPSDANLEDSTAFGNPFAIDDLGEGNRELDNIIASSLQQLESARAFYEHMQARVKKTE